MLHIPSLLRSEPVIPATFTVYASRPRFSKVKVTLEFLTVKKKASLTTLSLQLPYAEALPACLPHSSHVRANKHTAVITAGHAGAGKLVHVTAVFMTAHHLSVVHPVAPSISCPQLESAEGGPDAEARVRLTMLEQQLEALERAQVHHVGHAASVTGPLQTDIQLAEEIDRQGRIV